MPVSSLHELVQGWSEEDRNKTNAAKIIAEAIAEAESTSPSSEEADAAEDFPGIALAHEEEADGDSQDARWVRGKPLDEENLDEEDLRMDRIGSQRGGRWGGGKEGHLGGDAMQDEGDPRFKLGKPEEEDNLEDYSKPQDGAGRDRRKEKGEAEVEEEEEEAREVDKDDDLWERDVKDDGGGGDSETSEESERIH